MIEIKQYSRHWFHQNVVKDEGKNHGKGNIEWEQVKEDNNWNFGKTHQSGP